MKICRFKSKIGLIELVKGEVLERINFIPFADEIDTNDHLLLEAKKQINEYLDGQRTVFSLPFSLVGTDFQKKVWGELLKIPYGTTKSYKEIAINIGNEKASRAVGMANHNNPLPIIIPCHRVIGANGLLIGYAGGMEIKKSLLEIEGVI